MVIIESADNIIKLQDIVNEKIKLMSSTYGVVETSLSISGAYAYVMIRFMEYATPAPQRIEPKKVVKNASKRKI